MLTYLDVWWTVLDAKLYKNFASLHKLNARKLLHFPCSLITKCQLCILQVQFLIYDTSLFYFSVKSLFYLFWLFNVYFLENGLNFNIKICNKIISVTYIATSLVRRHFDLIVLSTSYSSLEIFQLMSQLKTHFNKLDHEFFCTKASFTNFALSKLAPFTW